MVTEGNTHRGGCGIEEEHAQLEPVDAEGDEIHGHADEGDQGGADQKGAGNPVNSVERNSVHKIVCWVGCEVSAINQLCDVRGQGSRSVQKFGRAAI